MLTVAKFQLTSPDAHMVRECARALGAGKVPAQPDKICAMVRCCLQSKGEIVKDGSMYAPLSGEYVGVRVMFGALDVEARVDGADLLEVRWLREGKRVRRE